MAIDVPVVAVFAAAAVFRLSLLVFLPEWSELLMGRVEVATPVTSFRRLQEGIFLYNQGISPYDGGIYHQAPLLLPLFSNLANDLGNPLRGAMRYILADLLSAQALLQIARSGESSQTRLFKSPRTADRWSPVAIAAAFLFNPFTVISCIGRPSNVFVNCAILQAIARAIAGDSVFSLIALAIASYLSMYPILLAPPLLFLLYDRTLSKAPATQSVPFFASRLSILLGSLSVLLIASWAATGMSWDFLYSTYGPQFMIDDLTPNIGLWWYFFIEMFDSFRGFFLGVFWLHLASYTGGLCIRLRSQPLFIITALLGVFAIFKPYPSIADASLYLSLVPLYRHVFPLLRYGFIAAAALMYSTFLGPAFYHLWIYAGSGNANFFYAITLVWGLGNTIVIADLLFAVIRDETETERPELKDKELRQI